MDDVLRSWAAYTALTLLLLVCFGGSAFELVDRWDNAAATGNDLVLGVFAPILCFGLGVFVASLLTWIAMPLRVAGMSGFPIQQRRMCSEPAAPFIAPSPPLLPLRI